MLQEIQVRGGIKKRPHATGGVDFSGITEAGRKEAGRLGLSYPSLSLALQNETNEK